MSTTTTGITCGTCGHAVELGWNDPRAAVLRLFIARQFQRHLDERHNADFEVCRDADCQAAFVVECMLVQPE